MTRVIIEGVIVREREGGLTVQLDDGFGEAHVLVSKERAFPEEAIVLGQVRLALEQAEHELTATHGATVTEFPGHGPAHDYKIDNSFTLKLLSSALETVGRTKA